VDHPWRLSGRTWLNIWRNIGGVVAIGTGFRTSIIYWRSLLHPATASLEGRRGAIIGWGLPLPSAFAEPGWACGDDLAGLILLGMELGVEVFLS
jgi:hypothetical protein